MLDASLPGGVSVGCFEAFTLCVTMGTRGAVERKIVCISYCCVIVLSQCLGVKVHDEVHTSVVCVSA